MLVDFNLFVMLCHFFNDANASMILTINSFKSKKSNAIVTLEFTVYNIRCLLSHRLSKI